MMTRAKEDSVEFQLIANSMIKMQIFNTWKTRLSQTLFNLEAQ